MRRPKTLDAPPFLVNQDRDLASAGEPLQFGHQARHLVRAFDVPFEQNESPWQLRLNERALIGVQFSSGYACDECARLHVRRLVLAGSERQRAEVNCRQFLWMKHCPPADFRLPQNCAASADEPNGPIRARYTTFSPTFARLIMGVCEPSTPGYLFCKAR